MVTFRKQYRRDGKTVDYEYFTLSWSTLSPVPSIALYGWGYYSKHSVLANQPMKQYLHSDIYALFRDIHDTEEMAEVAGAAMNETGVEWHWSSKWTEPELSLDHLSDEQDW